jgi:hypothetical protein
MKYRIQYFKENQLIGERDWWGHAGQIKQVADDDLAIHNADTVKILDQSGHEAITVKWQARKYPPAVANGAIPW